ncbi:MAG: hypothetical protein ABSE57_32690 [Bryobacteraceae bacterium]
MDAKVDGESCNHDRKLGALVLRRNQMVLAHRLGLVVGIHGHTNITSEKRAHQAKTWHDRMPGAESGLRCFPSWGIMRSEPDLDDPEIQSTAERQS